MNVISTEKRVRVIAALVEGDSIRVTVRIAGAFSKEGDNLVHAVSLHVVHYSFYRSINRPE